MHHEPHSKSALWSMRATYHSVLSQTMAVDRESPAEKEDGDKRLNITQPHLLTQAVVSPVQAASVSDDSDVTDVWIYKVDAYCDSLERRGDLS